MFAIGVHFAIAPDVVVVVGWLTTTASLEPVVLIAGVVGHEVDDNFNAWRQRQNERVVISHLCHIFAASDCALHGLLQMFPVVERTHIIDFYLFVCVLVF